MRSAAFVALTLLSGCGGGTPLLHPAHPLANGKVRAIAGFSTQIATGTFSEALRTARAIAQNDSAAPGPAGTNEPYAKAALVLAAIAPGVAPIAGGRVGLGGDGFEAGLIYTARSVRADVRRAFVLTDATAISVGIGGSSALYGREQGSPLPNIDLSSLRGYGVDVPLLVGWTSDAGMYQAWCGGRFAFDHVRIANVTSEPKSPALQLAPTPLSADHLGAAVIVGIAVGFRHVHVAMELDVSGDTVHGTYNGNETTVRGITLAPASALWWRF